MRRAAVILLVSVLASPAAAESMQSPEASSQQARASLDFRIVIPETVRIPSAGEQRDAPGDRFTSHTSETREDRILVTVAKP